MDSNDPMDRYNKLLQNLNKSDPGLVQLRRNIYREFQIFWKTVPSRSIHMTTLIPEYVDYKEICIHNDLYALLLNSIMELYLESLDKNKSKTIAVFSHNLGNTPYFENFWSTALSNPVDRFHEDARIRIRKKLHTYKEISEGMLKYVLPYVVTCLAIVQNKDNTDFEKNASLGLGNLVYVISESNYPAFKIITHTKTGLTINDLRNVSAHSSIRTFSNNQIELTLKKGHNETKIRVDEQDIDDDLESLSFAVFIIKFSISLFVLDNISDVRKKFVMRDEDLQPEDGYAYLTDCFIKFQYSVEDNPNISKSQISIKVKSLTKKHWKDILVELSIHLPLMGRYLEMINKKNITKVKIVGSDHSGKKVGVVELPFNLISELYPKNVIDLIRQIQFFDAQKNLLDNFFNKKAIKLIESEKRKVANLEKFGFI